MRRLSTLSTVAAVSGLWIGPLLAAGIFAASASAGASQSVAGKAETCTSALRAFTAKISKQGYWLGGSDYGYGYPMASFGYGYGDGIINGRSGIGATGGYVTARPGYEIRTLMASANILAHAGKTQACESVLASARGLYASYAADLHDSGVSGADQPNWRRREVAAAQPVNWQGRLIRVQPVARCRRGQPR